MTSKLTRERLAKIKSWRETYGAGSNVMLPAEEAEELARIALAAMDSEPVAVCIVEDGQMCPDGFGVCDHSLPDGTHELYAAPQPASVSITEAQVAALEEEEKSFHDAIRKCIASLRYHHKRAEAHSTGYKGSTLEDDTLKSIDFLKRNITAIMLSGGKP
ncbi:TPA: hypothetical protein ACQZPM_005101 [Klebsiella pneumoniae]